jgi:hypothetical protein
MTTTENNFKLLRSPVYKMFRNNLSRYHFVHDGLMIRIEFYFAVLNVAKSGDISPARKGLREAVANLS